MQAEILKMPRLWIPQRHPPSCAEQFINICRSDFLFFFVKSLHFRKNGIYYRFLSKRKQINFNIDEV